MQGTFGKEPENKTANGSPSLEYCIDVWLLPLGRYRKVSGKEQKGATQKLRRLKHLPCGKIPVLRGI